MKPKRIRSFFLNIVLTAMNWWSDHITFDADDLDVLNFLWWIQDRVNSLRWFGDNILSFLFGMLWHGSDEEIAMALRDEIPRHFMNERQRAAVFKAVNAGKCVEEGVCQACDDYGYGDPCEAVLLPDNHSNFCPRCRSLMPELLLEDRK